MKALFHNLHPSNSLHNPKISDSESNSDKHAEKWSSIDNPAVLK